MNNGKSLKLLRKKLGIKQGDFAKKISTTQGHISDIENGRKNLSDRTIKLICLEYDVNEDWLRTGKGEMFIQKTEDEELAEYTAELTFGDDDFIKNFIRKYMKLSESNKQIVRDLFN